MLSRHTVLSQASCSGRHVTAESCYKPLKHRNRRQQRLSCRATTRTYQPASKPLVKVCGVTTPEDAELAAKAGADFVGMILWPKARRAVSVETAARISASAGQHGAKPVAVFVDEDFATIVRTCKAAGIKTAQLHGKGARGALHDLPNWLQVVYVLHAGPDGSIQTKDNQTPLGDEEGHRQADWLLIDGLKGGSGEAYDWERLQPPALQKGMQGWLLAGGLTPANVFQAVKLAKPHGIDVSSGVTMPNGLDKDPQKVFQFIEQVRRAALDAELTPVSR